MRGGPAPLPAWDQLAAKVPGVTGPMRRYLGQIGCVLRPRSVVNADMALRCFAGFLAGAAPEVTGLAQVTRSHIEAFKPWLAARPRQNKPAVTTATIAHRLGTLRMFFARIDEWGWDDTPPRVPMFPGDLPRQDHPLPKALDDASAAKLLRAARADRRMLVRVTVEMLLRTGLRVSEYTGLPPGAVVLIVGSSARTAPGVPRDRDARPSLEAVFMSGSSSDLSGRPAPRPGPRCTCRSSGRG